MPDLKQEDLDQFLGSDVLYRHWTGLLYYTEGIKYLADHGEAHWLLNAIASLQIEAKIVNNQMLREIQFWELLHSERDDSARLICREDANRPPIIDHRIPFTDFPLMKVSIWVEYGSASAAEVGFIAMLPNER